MKNNPITWPDRLWPVTLKVLIVEDNPLIALDLEAMLIDEGCAVVGSVSTGGSALKLIASEDIDLAFVDHLLRDNSGSELIKRLRAAGIGYAICTALSLDETEAQYATRQIISKPYQIEDLRRILNSSVVRIAVELSATEGFEALNGKRRSVKLASQPDNVVVLRRAVN